MQRSLRRSRFIAAAAASAIGLSVSVAAPDGHGRAAAQVISQQRLAPPGPAGPAITLEDQAAYSGIDLATDPTTDTAYLGWISSNYATTTLRDVHLCVLPPKATSCAGGVLTADAIGDSTAAGLQVEVTAPGQVSLVWFYQHDLTTGRLGAATYANGVLAPSTAVADAPSNGQLFDVVPGPDGQLWALTQNDSGSGQNLQVRQGLTGAPQNLVAPWLVGKASLAFSGSKPIVLAAQAGSISERLHYASGIPWTGFAPIPKTWTLGEYSDIVTAKGGARMIGSEDSANYRPVVGRWKGSSFTTPKLIGDNQACPALTHDLVTDGSGRLADVSERCGKIGIYNLPKTKKAAIAKFSSGGTISSGGPQITTTTRGNGWVAWAIVSSPGGNKLLVRPVRLPALMKSKSAKEKGNKVTVTGPESCLPVVTIRAKLKTNPAPGWNLVSRQLKLDGDNVSSPVKIDGAKLAAGSGHQLVGKAVFKKGNQTVEVKRNFGFQAC